MTTTTNATIPAEQPAPVPHHFLITLQTGDGRVVTSDGIIPVIPGIHTRMDTLKAVRQHVTEQWALRGQCVVLLFALEPDQF
ncbi:hypothetical protein ACFWV1_20185 [Streptomyces sp. NPDC058700]|uniref:hypothetical protein n=1 Tax=Streptomyces sp. NPDC058700 TaxID=3346607 RepID=UPI003658210A